MDENGEHMPDISVIIPVYNAEKYLKKCLDSVCGQTLKNIEIILVDDGSTDGSGKLLDRYAEKDSRIRVIHQQNMFAGAARNRGMKEARGEYLSFLDSDDWFQKDMLEVMLEKAKETGADIVICDSRAYTENEGVHRYPSGETKTNLLSKNQDSFSKENAADYLFQISVAWAWDKLFRKDFIEKKQIYFQDLRTTNDGYFVSLAMAEARTIVHIPRHFITHRQAVQTSLENTREKSPDCCWKMAYALKCALEERGLYDELEKSFVNQMLHFLVWSLISLKDSYSMELLYCKLKGESFPALGINGKPKEYFYDTYSYQLYEKMMEVDFPEFLFWYFTEKTKELETLRNREKNKIWCFPAAKLPKGSRVVIYGAGDVGQDLYYQFCMTERFQIVKWVDRDYRLYRKKRLPVEPVENLLSLSPTDFDYVIIGILKRAPAKKVKEFLETSGILGEKIIWENLDCKRRKVHKNQAGPRATR